MKTIVESCPRYSPKQSTNKKALLTKKGHKYFKKNKILSQLFQFSAIQGFCQ